MSFKKNKSLRVFFVLLDPRDLAADALDPQRTGVISKIHYHFLVLTLSFSAAIYVRLIRGFILIFVGCYSSFVVD